jgi:hypothetical protein
MLVAPARYVIGYKGCDTLDFLQGELINSKWERKLVLLHFVDGILKVGTPEIGSRKLPVLAHTQVHSSLLHTLCLSICLISYLFFSIPPSPLPLSSP